MDRVYFEYDGQKYFVKKPTPEDNEAAEAYGARVFVQELSNKDAILKTRLNTLLKEQGLWSEEKEKKEEELKKILRENEKVLAKGKSKELPTLEKAKELALASRWKRFELWGLLMETQQYNALTVEGKAEEAKYNHLISTSVYSDLEDHVFNSVFDYLKADEKFKEAILKAYNDLTLDNKWQRDLFENAFLIRVGLMNEKLQLIRADKKPVDEKGRLINDDNRLINEDGQLINEEGDLIDNDGKIIAEFVEFE